ncbi:MAG: acyl-CoA thioesterase [Alphaproteobacteria bacterium]|nr:MAG: acyl-CoA thioesterase [Alphaproteobacteria bacterium]
MREANIREDWIVPRGEARASVFGTVHSMNGARPVPLCGAPALPESGKAPLQGFRLHSLSGLSIDGSSPKIARKGFSMYGTSKTRAPRLARLQQRFARVPEPYRYRHRVRYQETDQQGIVYHSRYFEYLDIAMTEFFRSLGWAYPDLVAEGLDPSVAETAAQFRAPALFDEEIDILVIPARIGTSSFVLRFRIERPGTGEKLLDARTVYVNISSETRRPTPIPETLKAKMGSRLEPEETPAL